MLRRLYDWTIDLASRPHALRALGAVSFAESSFFPIPPDAMIIPMVVARPDRAWVIAWVTTVTSVLGGVAGYAIGYFLFETIGQAIIDFYGYQEQFAAFRQSYNEYGVWIVIIGGLTPVPYKLVTIASGAVSFDFFVFFLASLLTRGPRFFLVAGLLKYFGPPIRGFIERRLGLVTTVFVIGLIGGFIVVRYLI